MANFNEIKEKVMTTIGNVADMTKDFAAQTGDKAKNVARIAKLTVEISNEKETIKKAYSEIGKLYYETHRDNPEGFFTQLCEEVSLANNGIAERSAEIAELKAELKSRGEDDGTIEVDFENVVSEAESQAECDCGHDHADEGAESCDCGADGEAADKTPVAKVAGAVADAARDVADAVKEAYRDITEKKDD